MGLRRQDYHWLQTPKATVLAYDMTMKEQWLASISLARVKHMHRHDDERQQQSNQRQLLRNWLTTAQSANLDGGNQMEDNGTDEIQNDEEERDEASLLVHDETPDTLGNRDTEHEAGSHITE